MELNQLKIFLDIAKTKSFVKAAALHHKTQPTVSFQIKSLEKELGIKLLDRAPRKVLLTTEGKLMEQYAQRIIQQCNELRTVLSNYREIASGDMHVATIPSIGFHELSPFLKQFIKKYPSIKVNIQYRLSKAIYELIRNQEIDLGIVAYPRTEKDITFMTFATDEMVVICPTSHRFSLKKNISLKELNGEPFIALEEGIPTREATDQLLKLHNVAPVVRMANENIETIKQAVEVGLGVAIVPFKTVEVEIKQNKLYALKIKDINFKRPLGILYKKGKVLTKAVQLFLKALLGKRYTGL